MGQGSGYKIQGAGGAIATSRPFGSARFRVQVTSCGTDNHPLPEVSGFRKTLNLRGDRSKRDKRFDQVCVRATLDHFFRAVNDRKQPNSKANFIKNK